MKQHFWITASLIGLVGCVATAQVISIPGVATSSPSRPDKLVLTKAEWKKRLTKEQFDILRADETESPFCGVNLNYKGPGIYRCVGCNEPLFEAKKKFESGTGWPSFYEPIRTSSIWLKTDRSLGMVRTEVRCAKCDGHLGHLFNDAPTPNGMRFCINGKVLKFVLNDTLKDAKAGH